MYSIATLRTGGEKSLAFQIYLNKTKTLTTKSVWLFEIEQSQQEITKTP